MITTFETQLLSKKELAPNIYFLSYKRPENNEFNFDAGQYMIFHIKTDGNLNSVRRLYSIASSPLNKSSVDFIIELIEDGVGSSYFKNTKVGDKLKMQGPAGVFTFKNPRKDVIFLSTGTGFAPIYSILQTVLDTDSNTKYTLFWGLKNIQDTYLINELKQLSSLHSNFDFKICLSREISATPPTYLKGHVDDCLADYLKNIKAEYSDFEYYICGGKAVVESIKAKLISSGVINENIYSERFS